MLPQDLVHSQLLWKPKFNIVAAQSFKGLKKTACQMTSQFFNAKELSCIFHGFLSDTMTVMIGHGVFCMGGGCWILPVGFLLSALVMLDFFSLVFVPVLEISNLTPARRTFRSGTVSHLNNKCPHWFDNLYDLLVMSTSQAEISHRNMPLSALLKKPCRLG
jgi:hypothetical protein